MKGTCTIIIKIDELVVERSTTNDVVINHSSKRSYTRLLLTLENNLPTKCHCQEKIFSW